MLSAIQSINKILVSIGEMRLPLDTNIDSLEEFTEAYQIREMLFESNRELQFKGYWFNEEEWVFSPDTVTKRINIPYNTLQFYSSSNVEPRGLFLYNRDNQSFIFDDEVSITANVIWEIPFEQVPSIFQEFVVVDTTIKANDLFRQNSSIDKTLNQRKQFLSIGVDREHLRHKKYNLISTEPLRDRGQSL